MHRIILYDLNKQEIKDTFTIEEDHKMEEIEYGGKRYHRGGTNMNRNYSIHYFEIIDEREK